MEKKSSIFWVIIGVWLVIFLAILDTLTGNDLVFAPFYLLPVVLVTLATDQNTGLWISFLSAVALQLAEIMAGRSYVHLGMFMWNLLARMAFYSLVAWIVAGLHRMHKDEQLAARTDFVTGALNARYFNELLEIEIQRIRRYPHPFTIVFIDIDNFKQVNDLFGHNFGDRVLRFITDELKSQLRKTDVVARVGGDEFALLLPSTRQPDAEVVLSKIRGHLTDVMKRSNLAVTFSMGVVTCVSPPYAAEQLVNLADELMYAIKKSTKNGIRFVTWSGS